MTESCRFVAERLALGEPLAELTEHVTSCAACERLVATTGQLVATRHSVDPGLGFSARMTVGAQHRIAVRRRRRLAAGLAATVAAGAFGVFVLTREPAAQPQQPAAADTRPPPVEDTTTLDDQDLAVLVDLADTRRSSRLSAHWARIQKPLAPYKKLVEGETP